MSDFFTSTILIFTVSLSVFSLISAAASLWLHWKRPEQHPDVSKVQDEILQLRASQLELFDRVEHWFKRDRTRTLRAAREKQLEDVGGASPSPEDKTDLRRRVLALRTPTPNKLNGAQNNVAMDQNS